jgi:hypothetical protein
MPLGEHSRTNSGKFRKERDDSLIKNLRKDYSELNGINGNMKLGTLKDKLGVDSLSEALKELRKRKS